MGNQHAMTSTEPSLTSTGGLRYHTGFGVGMAVLLAASLAPTAVVGIVVPEGRTVLLATTGVVVALLFALYLTTHYTFDAAALLVRCGPFTVDVPYESVRYAASSSSLMSGYGMSLERIKIEYAGGQTILISPADRAGFLEELHRRAPQAVIDAGEA